MKSCLIVEDDFSFALEVEMILNDLGFDQVDIADSISGAQKKIEKNTYSLIISDIKLGEGTYSYDFFNEVDLDIPLIYTSVLKKDDIYREVQKTKKHIYLVKPINKITLMSAIESVLEVKDKKLDLSKDIDFIKVKSNKSIYSLDPMDVLFIKSEGNYCTFYTSEKRYTVRQSLQHWREHLNAELFISVHRSYVVNLKKIQSVTASKNIVRIKDYEIPLGRKYKPDFLAKFDR